MLAANEAVALAPDRASTPASSAGATPTPSRASSRTSPSSPAASGFEIEQPQSRFELQRVLAETADKPEAYAVHYGLLRSLKQAVYTPEPEGHYALASEDYCHFTSPIRRYPDLQVHRQLTALLAGKKPKSEHRRAGRPGRALHADRAPGRGGRARADQDQAPDLPRGPHRRATSTRSSSRVEDFGLFCRLVELPVEGLVHVTSLADDYYYLEAGTHTLIGRRSGRRYRLGDRVEVTDRPGRRRPPRAALVPGRRPGRDVPAPVAPPAAPGARPRPRRQRPRRPKPKGKGTGRGKGKSTGKAEVRSRAGQGDVGLRSDRPARSGPPATRPTPSPGRSSSRRGTRSGSRGRSRAAGRAGSGRAG